MKVRAPGKLILSGEHAVVYGYPAIAMAVNRYVGVEIVPLEFANICFELADLNMKRILSVAELEQLNLRIRKNYRQFQCGALGVRDVLREPAELVQFALSLLLEEYVPVLENRFNAHNASVSAFMNGLNIDASSSISTRMDGFTIRTHSSIPMGCGMGSSAAMILSVLFAAAHYLNVSLSAETYLRLALEAENMQHGQSSGFDLYTIFHGGCVYRHGQEMQIRSAPECNFYVVNTGTPQSTTGECVAAASSFFKTSTMGDDFATITNAIDSLLQNKSFTALPEMIRANHQLLTKINVVPLKVQQFIHQIEQCGGAAKICGAGAVRGEHAGMILVLIEDELYLKKLCENEAYSLLPIQCESRGVQVV